MTDAEFADEIEQKAAIGDGHVALTNKKWQQSIAALRRQPSSDILKIITYDISLLEVEGDYDKCLQYLRAVEDKFAAAEAEGRKT